MVEDLRKMSISDLIAKRISLNNELFEAQKQWMKYFELEQKDKIELIEAIQQMIILRRSGP